MKPQLKNGRALVLHGPQGCGKTTKARELAAERGDFTEISSDEFGSCFQSWMRDCLKTCIVEGLPPRQMSPLRLKELIASEFITVERQHQLPRRMRAPVFIFCTSDSKAALELLAERRFQVIEVKA